MYVLVLHNLFRFTPLLLSNPENIDPLWPKFHSCIYDPNPRNSQLCLKADAFYTNDVPYQPVLRFCNRKSDRKRLTCSRGNKRGSMHFLTEVANCIGASWRRHTKNIRLVSQGTCSKFGKRFFELTAVPCLTYKQKINEHAFMHVVLKSDF